MNKIAITTLALILTACGGSDSKNTTPTQPASNSVPVSDAGVDQTIATTSVVTLNGSESSDADGDTLSYSWSLTTSPDGSSATLSNSTGVSPTFTADIDGSYAVQLIVNDGTENGVADTISIVAATANSAPVANAGADQNVATTSVVTLNGSASSDADGDALSYSWALTTLPDGSSATLNNSTGVSPTFTADIDGSYVAQLIVNDSTDNSVADTVSVVAATANSAPMANAGADQDVLAGTTVFLDASASTDADGDGLLYSWSFVSKPSGSNASFDNELAVNPSFTADLNGSYVIGLVVNDGFEDSVLDNVTIEAIQPSVRLYKKSGFFGPTFNETSFPYSSNGTVSASVSGIPAPTTYSLATFKLLAEGQNFTIVNLVVTDSTSQVVPFFTIISEGFELVENTEVEFELVSPLTRGATVILNFSFEIQETGDTFSSNYTFTSN